MKEILVPISVGELVDKITILHIKNEKISEPQKLVNIRNELNALTKVCEINGIPLHNELYNELKFINLELWKIEDDIREKERNKAFDEEFIQYARAVYITNDRRSQVKHKINLACGSTFVEEKSYKPYL